MGTGCQPLVTMPAWLLPLCSAFVKRLRQTPLPPLALQLSRLPVCHLLISFSGSRWSELSRVEYTPPLFITNTPSNRQLTWMNFGLPSVWNGQVWKVSFQHMTPDLNDSRFS